MAHNGNQVVVYADGTNALFGKIYLIHGGDVLDFAHCLDLTIVEADGNIIWIAPD